MKEMKKYFTIIEKDRHQAFGKLTLADILDKSMA